MPIICYDTYNPSAEERMAAYLARLANHLEEIVKDGGDPRQAMESTAVRSVRGRALQWALARRFAKKKLTLLKSLSTGVRS